MMIWRPHLFQTGGGGWRDPGEHGAPQQQAEGGRDQSPGSSYFPLIVYR